MMSKDVRVITLSGVTTIGRNSYVVEKDGKLLVIDYGIGFPDVGVFNINGILPDVSWLEHNRRKIAGIVITHAHMDHVGGLPYVIDKLGNPPIYGSRFAIEFIKEKLREVKKHKQAKLTKVHSGDIVNIGPFRVHFAHVTHSIPQCFAVAVDSPFGKIVYTGDFKFDATPINEPPSDTDILEKWALQGVLVSLLDSTNVYEAGYSKSETSIIGVLESILANAKGRVIIGMFSSLVSRLIGIMEIAKKLNKKVAFTGRSLETNVKIAMRIGYLMPQKDLIIHVKDVDKYPDNQVVIIATGSQGEHMAALTRMARGEHAYIKLKSTDTIIMSSSVIPTNVVPVQELMDRLSRTGATVINSRLMDVHVSGHAYQEELKQMAILLNSKYYIPVHGYTSFLFQHRNLLMEAGIPSRKILVPSEGSVYKFTSKGVVPEKKIRTHPVYVIGSELVSTRDNIVTTRYNMAGFGHVVVVVGCSRSKKLEVVAKGVLPAHLVPEATEKLKKTLSEVFYLKGKQDTKRLIYRKTGSFFRREYGLTPEITVVDCEGRKALRKKRTFSKKV